VTASTNRRTPAEIEASLAHTRERLAAGIDALQHRLRPEMLKRKARETARRTVLNNLGTLLRLVKRNPVPAVMIGAGVGWMLVRNRDD
jgi:hypothetical protein